jgi:hypothetical protein
MTTNPSNRKLAAYQVILGVVAVAMSLGLTASITFAGLPTGQSAGPMDPATSDRQNAGSKTSALVSSQPNSVSPLDCTITGSIDGSEPTKNSVLGAISACGTTTPCPGELTGDFHYDTYAITNSTGSPVCTTITLSDPQCIFAEVYSAPPTSNGCTNYVADNNAGSSFQVTIPANTTYYLAVEEYFEGQGCGNYTVTVTGAGITCPTGGTATVVATGTTTPGATGTGTVQPSVTRTGTVGTSTVVPSTTGTAGTSTVVPSVTGTTGTSTVQPSTTATAVTSTVVPSVTRTGTSTVIPSVTGTTGTSTVQPSTTATGTAGTSTVQPSATRTGTAVTPSVVPSMTGTVVPTRTQTVVGTVSATTTPCQGRVTICHRTGNGNSHTITVSCNALPAHLAHGDTIGPCPVATARPQSNRFSDVNSGDFFYHFVLDLNDDGALGGYNDGTFRPYNNATRAQLVKIVVLAFHIPLYAGNERSFTDVPTSHPFYQYIETAQRNGLVGGYADGTFRPYNNVTRGQIAKIAVEAAGMADVSNGIQSFSDVPVGSTFYNYIETAYANGILSGYADGTFRPNNDATRGQVAKIVDLATSSDNQ